jgi:hypothetical protein
VRKKWWEFFGILIDDRDSNDLFNNTLNSYLTKSLNVELVNIVLQAITQFSRKSVEDHLQNNEILDDDNYDAFNLLRRLEIPRIEIDNPDLWEVSKKEHNKQDIN